MRLCDLIEYCVHVSTCENISNRSLEIEKRVNANLERIRLINNILNIVTCTCI